MSNHNLSEIIEKMKSSADEHQAMVRDAERYRYLRHSAVIEDLYDLLGHGQSSWDWVIRLETGKSKGTIPPEDLPTFDETVDMNMRGTLRTNET